MTRRRLISVCVVALFGILFAGQDSIAQSGPCDPDPCATIGNATADSCAEISGSCTGPSDFFCSCDSGYTWQPATHTCQNAVAYGCDINGMVGSTDCELGCEELVLCGWYQGTVNECIDTCLGYSDTVKQCMCNCDIHAGCVVLTACVDGCLGSQPSCTDNDEDGYGDPASASCTYPDLDCDDTNGDVYPGAPETCDGVDNQCPGDAGYGDVDEGCDMVSIPAGCFYMGDHFGEGSAGELPVHNVCITAFEMDVHEVTNAEYKQCVDAAACNAPFYSQSQTRPFYYGNPNYDDYPVVYVSWNDATAYCAWAGKRLPKEAEYEYAARGGLAGKRYPGGDTITCDDANYGRGDSSSECWNYNGLDNDTHPVGTYPTNGYGLYDTEGNVAEWVYDWFDSAYYQFCVDHAIVNDPPGPTSGFARAFRTGMYLANSSDYVRVSARHGDFPGETGWATGFRCARGGYGP